MRTISCNTLLLVSAFLAACGPDEQPAVSSSFEVTATLAFTDEPPYYLTYPESESFVLRLEDAPDGTVTATWSKGGGNDVGVFDRTDAGLTLREPVQLPVNFGDDDPYEGRPYMTFESLRLVLKDHDDDGYADAVTGTGRGVLSYLVGDVPSDDEFTAELRGNGDSTPPQLYVVGGLHVLEGLEVRASELLQPGSTARAWHGDTSFDLTPLTVDGKYVRSFRTSAVLPFDAELRIEIDPVPRDLAGLAVESIPTTVRTMRDPGLFAEDGFESDPVAIEGGEIVTGVGTLPPIAGTRSLLIDPGQTLTLRIPVAAGDTRLRFRVRLLHGHDGTGCQSHEGRVGSPGTAGVQAVYIPPGWDGPTEEIFDSDWWGEAGPISDVDMALPAGTSGELIFDIYQLPLPVPPCPSTALLLDDLRVE